VCASIDACEAMSFGAGAREFVCAWRLINFITINAYAPNF